MFKKYLVAIGLAMDYAPGFDNSTSINDIALIQFDGSAPAGVEAATRVILWGVDSGSPDDAKTDCGDLEVYSNVYMRSSFLA